MDIPENERNHIKKYIENHPSDRLLLSSLPANLKRKISKDQYLSILRQMEEEGKGKIEETNNVTGPKAIVFTKKKKIEQQPTIPSSTSEQQTTTSSSTSPQQPTTTSSTSERETNETSLPNHEQTNQPSSTNQVSN